LLEGSVRFNVDPFGLHSEDEALTALESVGLLQTIRDEDVLEQRKKGLKTQPVSKLDHKANAAKTESARELYSKKSVTLKEKLEFLIEAGGLNLSLGQRQLICIARAILVPPKILLMDEATANIDQKTDSIIQHLIKNKLTKTTVVTIAHRLTTVCQYDKVIVLEDGKKV